MATVLGDRISNDFLMLSLLTTDEYSCQLSADISKGTDEKVLIWSRHHVIGMAQCRPAHRSPPEQ